MTGDVTALLESATATVSHGVSGRSRQGRRSSRAAADVALAQPGSSRSPRYNPNEVQYETIALSRGLRGRAGSTAVR